MRRSRFALAGVVALATVAIVATEAHAGDPAVDKRIYDAWVRYVDTLPAGEQVVECENFIKNYPDNTYVPQVKERLAKLKGAGKPATPPKKDEPKKDAPVAPPPKKDEPKKDAPVAPPPVAPPPTAPPPTAPPPTAPPPVAPPPTAPPPTAPPPVAPPSVAPPPVAPPPVKPPAASGDDAAMDEAAAGLGGSEDDAADALGGGGTDAARTDDAAKKKKSSKKPKDPWRGGVDSDFIELPPDSTGSAAAAIDVIELRKKRPLGFGLEITLGAALGLPIPTLFLTWAPAPAVLLDIGVGAPYLIGGRAGTGNIGNVAFAFEAKLGARFLFRPKAKGTVFLGLSGGVLVGDLDRLEAAPGIRASDIENSGAGAVIAPALGYQYLTGSGIAVGAQFTERLVIEREGIFGFPTADLGIRYFF